MNGSPTTLAVRIVLLTLFLLWVLTIAGKGSAAEYEVPNQGSPYLDPGNLRENEILHLPTGVKVTLAQLIDTLSGSRVIYVGETHDNLEAHRIQLEILRRLNERFPGRIAAGMEMFRRSAQPDLDRWHSGNLEDKEFRKLFAMNWGHGYKFYKPVFDYMRENSIPLFGLKSSKASEKLFREQGYSNKSGAFPSLDSQDEYHRRSSMAVFGGHQSHAEHLEKPYQMLLLWEESMAETVSDFLLQQRYRDYKLVVFAGGFHVQYGFGIPKRAFRRVPHPYSIVLPTVTHVPEELEDRKMDVKHVSIPLYAADFLWKVNYLVPPKSKIKLGVMLNEENDGLRVSRVEEGSNAHRSGILKGDLILGMDGSGLANAEDLVDRLQMKSVGDVTTFTIRRGSQELILDAHLHVSGE